MHLELRGYGSSLCHQEAAGVREHGELDVTESDFEMGLVSC